MASLTGERVDKMETAFKAVQDAIDTVKRTNDLNYAQIQGQLATAMSSRATSSASFGGAKTEDQQATHKLLANVARISGSETYKALDDWYAETKVNTDLIIPGSKLILDWAEQMHEEITQQHITSRQDSLIASRLTKELYAFRLAKTEPGGDARAQVIPLDSWEGLEAWRKIRKNLAYKDAKRLEDEYGVCTKLTPNGMNDLNHFNTLLSKLQADTKQFEKIDAAYAIGKFQRMNSIASALPKEIQKCDQSRESQGTTAHI